MDPCSLGSQRRKNFCNSRAKKKAKRHRRKREYEHTHTLKRCRRDSNRECKRLILDQSQTTHHIHHIYTHTKQPLI
jgi:hypothetical protein